MAEQRTISFPVSPEMANLLLLYKEAMEAIAEQTETQRGPLEEECSRENRKLVRRMKAALKSWVKATKEGK